MKDLSHRQSQKQHSAESRTFLQSQSSLGKNPWRQRFLLNWRCFLQSFRALSQAQGQFFRLPQPRFPCRDNRKYFSDFSLPARKSERIYPRQFFSFCASFYTKQSAIFAYRNFAKTRIFHKRLDLACCVTSHAGNFLFPVDFRVAVVIDDSKSSV